MYLEWKLGELSENHWGIVQYYLAAGKIANHKVNLYYQQLLFLVHLLQF